MSDEYRRRINKVMDYIDSLEQLARVASCSPFHFRRNLKAFLGETLGQFVQRLRMEKAASLLVQRRKASITEITYDCGFSSPAVFARVFKAQLGMTGGEQDSSSGAQQELFFELSSSFSREISQAAPVVEVGNLVV